MRRKASRRESNQGLIWMIGVPLVVLVAIVIAVVLKVGGGKWFGGSSSTNSGEPASVIDGVPFSEINWSYDDENNVYYQLGVSYASKAASDTYETMGIYVPGEYLTCTANGEKYTCALNETGELNGYGAASAPMVLSVDTPEFAAMKAPATYNYRKISNYMKKGFVYLQPGCRGWMGDSANAGFATGAPWGVVDLKAVVRYVRYKGDYIPGNKDAIFAFGASEGGAQAAVLGASGDSPLFTPYLEEIGAVMNYDDGTPVSDAIAGVSVWCPMTELATADMAYEWNMGQYTRELSDWKKELSEDLAKEYVNYVNLVGFSKDGVALTLDSEKSGSYYDYIVAVAEKSLNDYLIDKYSSENDRARYVTRLGDWVKYDGGVVSITDFAGFIKSQKPAKEDVPAFDAADKAAAENKLFASDKNEAMHFDDYMLTLLLNQDYGAEKVAEYQSDLFASDKEGSSQWKRVLMYTPTVYLMDYYGNVLNNTSVVAPYWRIRSGMSQTETALVTEVNLALALENNAGVEVVDFETVWGKGHEEAERTGTSTGNSINWVEGITKGL